VKRSENQVTGFRSSERELDGLEVAHFSHHDDIGVFTQRTAQCLGKGLRVRVDFALIHVAALGVEHVFDRIFQGENVVFAVAIDEINQSRQSRRFSGSHRARDENQTVVISGERHDVIHGQADIGDAADVGADDAENHVEPQTLAHHGGTETSLAVVIGKVHIAFFLKTLPFRRTEEGLGQLERLLISEWRVIFPYRLQLAISPPSRRVCGGEVHIGAAIFLAEAEILVNVIEDGVRHGIFVEFDEKKSIRETALGILPRR
jgi:hypothetical protein